MNPPCEDHRSYSVARNPDTVFLLGLLLISGTGQLIAGAPSGSVALLVPPWMLIAWSVTITLAAAIVLAGALWRGRDSTGLMVEAVGRVMLAPTSLAYALAVVASAGAEAGQVAALLVGLAVSSVWRIVQITRAIHGLRRDLTLLEQRQAES